MFIMELWCCDVVFYSEMIHAWLGKYKIMQQIVRNMKQFINKKKFYVFAGMRKNTNIVKWGGWWSWWEWFNAKGEMDLAATCLNSRMSEAKMQQLNWWQRIGGNIQKRRGATQPSQQSKTPGKTGRGAVAANLLSIIQKRFCSFRRVSGCAWFWITKKQTSLF